MNETVSLRAQYFIMLRIYYYNVRNYESESDDLILGRIAHNQPVNAVVNIRRGGGKRTYRLAECYLNVQNAMLF